MMHYPEFGRRFRDHQEIGREVTEKNLFVFYDNGKEVGLWCEDRRTTQGMGRVLGREDSEMARYWYRDVLRKWADAERKRQAAGAQSLGGSLEQQR
jgi:hypothetical protein